MTRNWFLLAAAALVLNAPAVRADEGFGLPIYPEDLLKPFEVIEATPTTPSVMVVDVTTPTTPIELKPLVNTAFKVGESLTFALKYQFIGAGTATMEVNQGDMINGRPTMVIESRAESNSVIDKFFKVRDYNASTVDAISLASLRFHQNLQEGRYQVTRTTTIDYKKREVHFERTRRGTTTTKTTPIQRQVQDVLSAFFVTRTMVLELGKEYLISVFSDDQVYFLRVKVDKKEHKISVPAGKFNCILVEPIVIGDSLFKAKEGKEGKIFIYLTNDERKMPVLIRSKVMIGAFDAQLIHYDSENE